MTAHPAQPAQPAAQPAVPIDLPIDLPGSLPPATTLVHPKADGYTTVELDPVADRAAMIDIDEWAFSFHYPPEAWELLQLVAEPGRSVGVTHDGHLVAMHASYEGTLSVPGATVPAAGLTWVGVHPGHRRRGIATAMLTTHLRRTAERGEPVSVLFAAEPEIYGRYGYGLAATSVGVTLGRGAALRDVPGTDAMTCELERVDVDRHRGVVADLLGRSARPGQFLPARDAHLINHLVDVPAWRDGAEARRIAVVHDREGRAQAFCLFRRKEEWEPAGPNGTVRTSIWAADDPAAAHRLWSTLTDLDLMGSVKVGMLAPDDPLLQQLVNIRAARLTTTDNIWVRLVDVPAALTARRYRTPVDVVLDVADDLLPDNTGRWRLTGGPDGATVEPAGTADLPDGHALPELAVDVRDLGAAYLGGTTISALVAAGLVRPGSSTSAADVDAVSAAFEAPLAPVCAWVF